MKVTAITPRKNKQGQDVWMVNLEGDERPLWSGSEPNFQVGFDVSEDSIQLSKNGNSYIFKRRTEQLATPKPTWKPSKDNDDIMLQVALKEAGLLERHHIVPEGKLDDSVKRVLKATTELFAGLLLLRPKREEK